MKRHTGKIIRPVLALSASLLWLCTALPASADYKLDYYQELYWRWAYGQVTIAPDINGNADVGHVVLMPFPSTPGDGTPGTQNATLSAGQSFMLPLWNLLGNSYMDGTPPDALISLKVFKTLNITVTIDGKTVIDGKNVMDFYSSFYFHPPIPLANQAPEAAVIWLQGIGLLHDPLSVGQHVIKMDAVNTDTADVFGLTFNYRNTWNVTVEDNARPRILPPDSHPFGKSYTEWSEAHWRWVYSIPAANHPAFQDGSIDLSEYQPDGPVWFLIGSFAATPVSSGFLATAHRTATVPHSKALFFPIIDAEASTAEGNGSTKAALTAAAESFIEPTSALSCEIDGLPVQDLTRFHFISPVFTWGPLPAGNLLGLPRGTTSPSVSDGFFVMMAPLTPGQHTVHFTGTAGVSPNAFTLDITYDLNVEP